MRESADPEAGPFCVPACLACNIERPNNWEIPFRRATKPAFPPTKTLTNLNLFFIMYRHMYILHCKYIYCRLYNHLYDQVFWNIFVYLVSGGLQLNKRICTSQEPLFAPSLSDGHFTHEPRAVNMKL